MHLTEQEQRVLLVLARRSATAAVGGDLPPEIDAAEVTPTLNEQRGCFVTLTVDGKLRGCIGSVFPTQPLVEGVRQMAANAATHDPRFPRMCPEELETLRIEVSVLTMPAPLGHKSLEELLEKLRPGIDGVVLRAEGRQSTYLPQVWEHLPEKELFLSRLARKAGLASDAWTKPDAEILVYQTEAFDEHPPRSGAGA